MVHPLEFGFECALQTLRRRLPPTLCLVCEPSEPGGKDCSPGEILVEGRRFVTRDTIGSLRDEQGKLLARVMATEWEPAPGCSGCRIQVGMKKPDVVVFRRIREEMLRLGGREWYPDSVAERGGPSVLDRGKTGLGAVLPFLRTVPGQRDGGSGILSEVGEERVAKPLRLGRNDGRL